MDSYGVITLLCVPNFHLCFLMILTSLVILQIFIDVIVQRLGDATAAGVYKLLFGSLNNRTSMVSLYALPVCVINLWLNLTFSDMYCSMCMLQWWYLLLWHCSSSKFFFLVLIYNLLVSYSLICIIIFQIWFLSVWVKLYMVFMMYDYAG